MGEAKDAIAAQARREAATLLGVNAESPTAADSLRLDMVSALRLVIDHEQGNVLSGKAADLGRLNVAVTSLIALLPNNKLPEPASNRDDPREIMWRNYLEQRRRGALVGEGIDGARLTIERLKTELAAKDTRIAELEAALAGSVPLPPNAVKLPTRSDNPPNERICQRSQNSPSPPAPPPPAAPAAAAPVAPRAASQDWDSSPGGQAWHSWREAGGYDGVPGSIGDRWSDRRD